MTPYLLHGLLTMASAMFWSIKMSKEREKPKPIAATAADRGNCSMGALSMVRTSLYRKWSTVKIIQHGVHQVCSREKRENKKRKEITDKMTELVKRETCHGRCKKREWSKERKRKRATKTSLKHQGNRRQFIHFCTAIWILFFMLPFHTSFPDRRTWCMITHLECL